MSKLRNRGNLVITIGVAPVLALLIATLLRYSDEREIRFRVRLSHPDVSFPWPDRGDVSWR